MGTAEKKETSLATSQLSLNLLFQACIVTLPLKTLSALPLPLPSLQISHLVQLHPFKDLLPTKTPTPLNNPWNYQILQYAQPREEEEGDETFHDEQDDEKMGLHKYSQSYDVEEQDRASIQFATRPLQDSRRDSRQSFTGFGSGQNSSPSLRCFDTKRSSKLLNTGKDLVKPVNRAYVVS